ncbi:16S rRNA (guanine(966)-N(2))-methyltransferase RsmD [Geoalkalibacter halelectricus]|uniref:16S rRNA (Guanine(966)-N(2))-methyltransferase RsmD n=1 Tax=Geoalkalibacter halelectricus TaxID=2847045 RepID=A0ABY5ZS14_9BACT|nr:16S rRNA (guanine(966)-N(2))-methyltransferase RsmD [Geoalkalibacter halelectricus]MDO3379994.1 16S rRNA (guanine(966)-N(2))-methyltransferase RsmD [Geoalkalibacter halelectricus]UWZ80479.1 16S rRNA (guanine(966)-N(2))-methyltransferase RsmD [Geoalkalibacter halelectricus]
MRIISGAARGTRLATFSGKDIRPTSDRVREAIFSILYSRMGEFTGKRVLDLYAGTGALALEALSRGAQSAVLIDADRQAVRTIEANSRNCRLTQRIRILCGDVVTLTSRLTQEQPFDLIFIDPPYAKGLVERTLKNIADFSLLAPGGLLCAETSSREEVPATIVGTATRLVLADKRTYGSTSVHFFSHPDPEDLPA